MYPEERSAFSEICETYSEEDQVLISEEFLAVWDWADEQGEPFDFPFFERVEPRLNEEMEALYGRS